MLNSSKRAVSLSNHFFFFSCNNLGNKAKDSVGTGELYFLSDAIMLIFFIGKVETNGKRSIEIRLHPLFNVQQRL